MSAPKTLNEQENGPDNFRSQMDDLWSGLEYLKKKGMECDHAGCVLLRATATLNGWKSAFDAVAKERDELSQKMAKNCDELAEAGITHREDMRELSSLKDELASLKDRLAWSLKNEQQYKDAFQKKHEDWIAAKAEITWLNAIVNQERKCECGRYI